MSDETIWSREARQELRQKIAQLTADDMQRLIDVVLSQDDPDFVIPTLRGAAFGLADRRAREGSERQRRKER